MNLPGAKLPQYTAESGLSARDAVGFVTSSATVTTRTMSKFERTLICTMVSANLMAVTLPKVTEVAGEFLVIYYNSPTSYTGNLTINDAGDDTDFAQITLDADKEVAVIYCDGIRFYTIQAGAQPTG